ncbi:hypothetical protein [uncultured Brachyspira sp.]|uniref:hypothetical protein n=1 Tax=uncultured Brachyspira sp. TaxID=221953 RepID=UPI00262956BB|nr:hypothetical protein [uncultured Brachyspira sp.]
MKNTALLIIIITFILISCKTGTLVVVPIPNIEMTIHPPQTNLKGSYNFNNHYSNSFYSYNEKIEMVNAFDRNLEHLLIVTNNFVYLK